MSSSVLITGPFISALGFAAGTLTTLSLIPQVHKAWRTRRCDDLSLGMLLALGGGVTLWLNTHCCCVQRRSSRQTR